MGRKTSKRCCIYHKTRRFGESDSEESDSDVEVARKQEEELEDGDHIKAKPKNFQRFHA